jgi:hypothetical protein
MNWMVSSPRKLLLDQNRERLRSIGIMKLILPLMMSLGRDNACDREIIPEDLRFWDLCSESFISVIVRCLQVTIKADHGRC